MGRDLNDSVNIMIISFSSYEEYTDTCNNCNVNNSLPSFNTTTRRFNSKKMEVSNEPNESLNPPPDMEAEMVRQQTYRHYYPV